MGLGEVERELKAYAPKGELPSSRRKLGAGRGQAGGAGGPEGCGSLCERAGPRRAHARGWRVHSDHVLRARKELPYDKWRDYDAEDTIRFYALRLHETGMIKSSPQKIIADGTDWRFLNELKHELKT